MEFPPVSVAMPDWMPLFLGAARDVYATPEDRMGFVLALTRENVRRGTGGPFGAAVFDAHGRLVAPGVNIVIPDNCSVLHAEIVAIMFAQNRLGRYDLSDGGRVALDLYAGVEPCAMCQGATLWSGVSGLVCGARDEDARAIGFDEGAKPADWVGGMESRGIAVTRDVLRHELAAALREYAEAGGVIYNAGRVSD